MNPADDFDPLHDLLAKREAGPIGAETRQRALDATLPVLSRRRVVRKAGWALAFAGCYWAGVVTTGFWHRGVTKQPLDVYSPEPPHEIPAINSQLAERQKTPFERLRDAGDEAWQRQGDIAAAVRLYAQALDVATPEEMKISAADDSWLLMTLKQDHVQENDDVKHPDHS